MTRSLNLNETTKLCAVKEFFVFKECHPVRNTTKRIKQILDAEYKKFNLNTIVMNLNYLQLKYKLFCLELLQKYEEIFDQIYRF